MNTDSNCDLLKHDETEIVSNSLYSHNNSAVIINDDGTPDVAVVNSNKQSQEIKVYKRRWYVLLAFSLVALMQGGLWNTWGPIAASSEEAFGWTDGDIALFANWGPIAYLIATFPSAWIVDTKGKMCAMKKLISEVLLS